MTTASRASTPEPIPFETFAARRAELGEAADLPRNTGTRRTPSKRALLKAIEEAGGKW